MASRVSTDKAPAIRSFPARIMVVEDAVTTREMLGQLMRARGYRVSVVGTDELLSRLEVEQPDVVLINLVGRSGLDVIQACRRVDGDVPLIVVSDAEPDPAHGPVAPDAGIIIRPFLERQVEEALTNALGPMLRPDIVAVRPSAAPHPAAALLGESPQLVEVRRLVERVASSNATVLIRGESGTGKEVTARALRLGSRRADKPFVKVNCAALPVDLLESELFGYERGAFTGALQAKPGKFELADMGTIFLDEIGDMSPSLQAKLLQVLQDGEFARLGSTSDAHVNVRVIAATNRDLRRAVVAGEFRQDLYFRLNVVCIVLPPLREHREDLPLLTEHFLRLHADAGRSRSPIRLSAAMQQLFQEYTWPGNVRELDNLIHRIIVLGSEATVRRDLSEAIDSPDLAPMTKSMMAGLPRAEVGALQPPTSLKDIGRTAAREAERAAILAMLQRTRWNRKEAAENLGISYKALLYKIKENHLDDAQ